MSHVVLFSAAIKLIILYLVKVYRLPLYPQASDASHGLIVSYATKEKKQKSEYKFLLFQSPSLK